LPVLTEQVRAKEAHQPQCSRTCCASDGFA
jgi:hypothetical protein